VGKYESGSCQTTPLGTLSDQCPVSGSGIQVNLRAIEDCTQGFGNLQTVTKTLATKIRVGRLGTWCSDICNYCGKMYCKL